MGLFRKNQKKGDNGYYQGPGLAKLSSIVCSRCGCDLHLIRRDQIVTINDKQYCDVCAEYLKKLVSEPKHFCVAGNRTIPTLVKKIVPSNVLCVKCGISMVNDGTVRHMGDKYYCKACYDKMAEKLAFMKIGKQEKEIKQELVYALNAVFAKRVRIQREEEIKRIKAQQEEERKRLELERLYHTKCFSCGVEHPKSAFYLVNDMYYCEECFSKMFAFGNEDGEKDK